MTEFKKLVTLTDALQHDVEALEAVTSTGKVDEACTSAALLSAQDTATRIKSSLTDATPRMRKIVLKARETDPNKQIYNETMCGKIESLFQTYCGLLARLYPPLQTASPPSVESPDPVAAATTPDKAHTDDDRISLALLAPEAVDEDFFAFENAPRLEAVEDAHNAYTLRVAHEEAWQARVALKLDDAALFEQQGRAVLMAEERTVRATMLEDKRQDKLRVQTLLREREETLWRLEQERRTREHAEMRVIASRIAPDSCGAFIQSSLPSELHKTLALHLHGLVRALVATPEDVNIRKMRNNNAQFLRDFGNFGVTQSSDGSDTPCICAAVAHTSEAILYRMGYRLRYTGTGTPSPVFLVSEGEIEDVTLPCGVPVSHHAYHPLGFERYSERYLELSEPNAMHNADAWMAWYTSLQEMEASLRSLT